MHLLINFIIIFIILTPIRVCLNNFIQLRNTDIVVESEFPMQDTDWLVAIFQITYISPSVNENVFKCLGALIHERGVLTSPNCVPMFYEPVIRVRHYEWLTFNNTIYNPDTPFEEQRVLVISNVFSREHNTIHLLILSAPLKLVFKFPMKADIFTDENGLKFDREKFISESCMFVTAVENRYNSLTLRFVSIDTMFKPDCCYEYGYTSELVSGWFGFYTFDQISNECYATLEHINCFNTFDICLKNTKYVNGPVICKDEGSVYLYGMEHVQNRCILEIVPLTETKYIIMELEKYIVNYKI